MVTLQRATITSLLFYSHYMVLWFSTLCQGSWCQTRCFPILLIYRLACSSKLERCAVLSKLRQEYRQQREAKIEEEISQKLVGLFGLILGGSLCLQELFMC